MHATDLPLTGYRVIEVGWKAAVAFKPSEESTEAS